MTRLAIVDIETTGLDSEKHQILADVEWNVSVYTALNLRNSA
jgi:uncharacterized protein YprB with RNaseH-like and TPR domain